MKDPMITIPTSNEPISWTNAQVIIELALYLNLNAGEISASFNPMNIYFD